MVFIVVSVSCSGGSSCRPRRPHLSVRANLMESTASPPDLPHTSVRRLPVLSFTEFQKTWTSLNSRNRHIRASRQMHPSRMPFSTCYRGCGNRKIFLWYHSRRCRLFSRSRRSDPIRSRGRKPHILIFDFGLFPGNSSREPHMVIHGIFPLANHKDPLRDARMVFSDGNE
jgi:hypothetical protein